MKLLIKERAFTTGMILLAAIVVIVLGVLQYRWSNQVSEATSIRLADSLQMSMINWHLDLFRDFSEICIALRVEPDGGAQDDWNQYVRRFDEWKKATAHPDIVSGLYVLRFDETPGTKTLRLDPSGHRFEPGGWPANFGGISMSAFVMRTATGFRSLPCASSPSRCASSGIDPPPQKGS